MRWSEGVRIAEEAAWARKGHDNANFFIYRRLLVPGLIAGAIGGLGYGAYRGWHWLADGASSSGHGGVPSVMWVLLAVLIGGTVFAVKGTGRVRPFGVLAVVTLLTILAWLVWLGALGYLLA